MSLGLIRRSENNELEEIARTAASEHPSRTVRRREPRTSRTYGKAKRGQPIDEAMIETFADEAEKGYEPGQPIERPRGRGRPPLGAAAKIVESARLEPSLRAAAADRGAEEGVTSSEVIGRAHREYSPAHNSLGRPQPIGVQGQE